MKFVNRYLSIVRRHKRKLLILLTLFLIHGAFRIVSFFNNLNSEENFALEDFEDNIYDVRKFEYRQDSVRIRREIRGINEHGRKIICPEHPPDLLGDISTKYPDLNPPEWSEIATANPNISEGGFHSPASCKARHRVAIIIPLRGREVQLRALLSHMHPVWQRQQIEYTVYTISQAGNNLFNRAKLLNVGFVEANKDRKYDCYVFHDVDLMVENDKCLYWCSHSNSRQLAKYIDKNSYWKKFYRVSCPPAPFFFNFIQYFGGVSMMSREHFDDVNGYSNLYWGWGGEDDDMYLRLWRKGYSPSEQQSDDVCKFHMIDHERESKYDASNGRQSLLYHAISRMENEGLNTLRYQLLSIEKSPLYTNITVNLGKPNEKLKNFHLQRPPWLAMCSERMPWN